MVRNRLPVPGPAGPGCRRPGRRRAGTGGQQSPRRYTGGAVVGGAAGGHFERDHRPEPTRRSRESPTTPSLVPAAAVESWRRNWWQLQSPSKKPVPGEGGTGQGGRPQAGLRTAATSTPTQTAGNAQVGGNTVTRDRHSARREGAGLERARLAAMRDRWCTAIGGDATQRCRTTGGTTIGGNAAYTGTLSAGAVLVATQRIQQLDLRRATWP